MDEPEKRRIAIITGELFENGYHCSEAVLLGAGGHHLGGLHPQAVRLATPFAGGVGSTQAELCGALTGGLLVIGAQFGRAQAGDDDTLCQEKAAVYRAAFLQTFGWLRCHELKEKWIGNAGQPNCRTLVEEAAFVLMDLLDKAS